MKRCYGCFSSIKDELDVCPFCGYTEGTTPEESVHMNPGTILLSRYIIGKVIGYGGFGVTYIGWDAKLEQKVAIKEYLPSEFSTRMPGQSAVSVFGGVKNDQFIAGLNKFVDEAKRLSKFQNEEGIVTIYDCIAENNTAYIIMEFLDGETLAEKLKREKKIPEKEAISIMLPVMESLKAVHKEGIIHRDISPDNIFLTNDGKVKLIDFGAARFATTSYSRSLTVIIKPGYSAEEQYRSRSDQGPYTDVYSIAATLYKMITGETPPDALERRAKIENAKKDILIEPHKLNRNITLTTENALLNALNIQTEDRTQTIEKLIEDIDSDIPVKRVYGKIKKLDLYRIPLWLKISVPTLIVVLLTFGILIAAGAIRFETIFKTNVDIPDGYTVVPTIEGLTIDEATTQLKLSNLNYSTGGNITSEYIVANFIVYQDPEGGRIIPINSLVSITVSRGNGEVAQALNGIATVPIFVWSEEKVAVNDFTKAGLKTTVEYIYDENISAGQVIRATDINGKTIDSGMQLAEGSMVILYVSKGAEGFLMPNVIGYTENDAKKTLEEAGLVVSISHVYDSTVTEGTVFAQSIDADSKVTLGTVVEISVASLRVTDEPIETTETTETINVSTSTEISIPTSTPMPAATSTPVTTEKKYVVPDVIGMEWDRAEQAIFDAGFDSYEWSADYSGDVPYGIIMYQSPSAGEVFDTPHVTVCITQSFGPSPTPTPVPDVYEISVSDDGRSATWANGSYSDDGWDGSGWLDSWPGYGNIEIDYSLSGAFYDDVPTGDNNLCYAILIDGCVPSNYGFSDLGLKFYCYDPQTGDFTSSIPISYYTEAMDYGGYDPGYGPNCMMVEFYDSSGNLLGTRFSNVIDFYPLD